MALILRFVVSLSTLLVLGSCNHFASDHSYVEPVCLEVSYDGGWRDEGVFSIRINNRGEVWLSKNRWPPHMYYKSSLSQTHAQVLFNLIARSKFNELSPDYKTDDIADRHSYVIWVTSSNSTVAKVSAYGDSVPPRLDSLRQVICLVRDTIKPEPMSEQIYFPTRSQLYPVPSKSIKFSPPQL